jgi:hypothetical protein
MLAHRFQDLVPSAAVATPALAPMECAFIPCPVAVLASAAQIARVQEIYRLAAELTLEQLTPRRPFRIPAFSRN